MQFSRHQSKGSHWLFFSIIFLFSISVFAQFKTGAECTFDYFPKLVGKRIGLVVNQTSVIGKVHLVDSLQNAGFNIVSIFAPEHGFRGDAEAGAKIPNKIDVKTGIQVVSLYGKKKMPDSADLAKIDVLVFDIQDVGVRFYTFISTLHYVMDAAQMHGKKMIILDRPNPNGHYIDGPILEPDCKSFVGMHPVPIVHGLTIAEYATMINGEGWLSDAKKCQLEVVLMQGYTHQMKYNLPIPPSPNLPNMHSVYLYPSTCLFEGTTASLGRGTPYPFQWIGFPEFPIKAFSFIPIAIPGKAENPPHKNKICYGLDFSKLPLDSLSKANQINLSILLLMLENTTNKDGFFNDFFEKLAGNKTLKNQLLAGLAESEIRKSWHNGLQQYSSTRKKYLLYAD